MENHESVPQRASIWLDLTIIAGIALMTRLAWAIIGPTVDPFLIQSPLLGDAASYDRIARSIMAGEGYIDSSSKPSAFWPPLYPAFLSLLYSITGYKIEVARIAQAFLGVVVPVSFFLISIRSFGRRTAWLSAIGLIFYPHLVYFNAWLIAESLFMALMALGLLIISILPDKPGFTWVAIAGLFFGLAALAKPFMLFVMPFLALWLLLAFPKGLSQRIMAVSVLAVATLAIILPWTVRNYKVYDQVVLISTNGGYTFLGANNPNAWGGHDEGFPGPIPGLNGAEMEDAYYAEAIQWIRNNPQDFAQLLIPKYKRLFSPLSVASFREDYNIPGRPFVYLFYAAFLLTAIFGAVKAWPKRRRIGFLYAPIGGVFLSAGLYYGDARYTLPMVPSLVVFAALVTDSIYVRFLQR